MARLDQRAVRKGRLMVFMETVLMSRFRPRSDLGTLAVGGADDGLDPTAHAEVAHYLDPAGSRHGHEVVEDAVGHIFVEGALVAIGPDIELDAFQLDERPIGHVANPDGGEVGLARLGAEAGELPDLEGDLVVAVGMRIGYHLELGAGLARHGPYSTAARSRDGSATRRHGRGRGPAVGTARAAPRSFPGARRRRRAPPPPTSRAHPSGPRPCPPARDAGAPRRPGAGRRGRRPSAGWPRSRGRRW